MNDIRLTIRECRKIFGRKFTDIAKNQPVAFWHGGEKFWLAYRSDSTYQILEGVRFRVRDDSGKIRPVKPIGVNATIFDKLCGAR